MFIAVVFRPSWYVPSSLNHQLRSPYALSLFGSGATVKLPVARARELLVSTSHGVLSTVHESARPHSVPVVYAIDGDHVAVPIDDVKAKSTSDLQRVKNLTAEPRACLLIEHWDREDWSTLWWVRADLELDASAGERQQSDLSTSLRHTFPQYRDATFHSLLVFRIVGVTGWAAGDTNDIG